MCITQTLLIICKYCLCMVNQYKTNKLFSEITSTATTEKRLVKNINGETRYVRLYSTNTPFAVIIYVTNNTFTINGTDLFGECIMETVHHKAKVLSILQEKMPA